MSRNKEKKHFLCTFPHLHVQYGSHSYRKNIENYKKSIRQTRNIFRIGIKLLKIIKNIVKFLFYKKKFTKHNFHIYFSPFCPVPDIIMDISSIKIFHILYDCIPVLEGISYVPMNPNHWFLHLLRTLNKKTYFFCISECTKRDFIKIAAKQLDEKKMFVTHIASSQSFSQKYDKEELRRVLNKYGISQKQSDCYIFSLCNLDPRKGLLFTIKCFIEFIKKHKIDNLYFYHGGGYLLEYVEQLSNEIAGFADYKDKYVLLGYVADEDVNILYGNSLFFTYLSQYEGFGMPPLEAMQSGTPVICSDNSSLPEVVGEAAVTIKYNDEKACIKAFEDLYFNDDLRKNYIKKGLQQAKLFSWENTFNKMNNIMMSTV
jgi:glycosyltransferase involved in cell wall biosynthesis